MLNVGLTGGIASGKSTVAQMFAGLGARLIDFDKLAHEVQEPGRPAWREVVDHFGEGILQPDRRIDRAKLAAVVFNDPERLNRLNAIVHPRVFEAWRSRLEEIKARAPHAVVLSDVPLLFEGGTQHLFDLTILVMIEPEAQIERLMARNAMSREEATLRLSCQMPIREKIRLADMVIDNSGAVLETAGKVSDAWRDLLEREKNKICSSRRIANILNREEKMIEKNVKTDFSAKVCEPVIGEGTYVHPLAAVIGHVIVGKNVMVAPTACVRGDEGQPLYVGDDTNVQDGVVIHALETEQDGEPVEKNLMNVNGEKYAVYVGHRVSLAHQAQIHGPAVVMDDTFVGMKALVFKSFVGSKCVIEPGVILMGVNVADGRYAPAGSVIKTQAEADALPVITGDYPLKDMNKGVLHVNKALAKGYLAAAK